LCAARSTEAETVFGHIKQNMDFRRFHLRGREKVKTKWELVSIAHNLKKLATGSAASFFVTNRRLCRLAVFTGFGAVGWFFPDSPESDFSVWLYLKGAQPR
jgi:hypothetical protein